MVRLNLRPRANSLCSSPIQIRARACDNSVCHPSSSAPARRAAAINHHLLAASPIRAQPSAHRAATLPKYAIRKPERASIFLFTHHQRPSSHHSGREFYYRVFLPSPINDSESFTRKECTGTGHQPSDVGVSAAFLSIRVSKGKWLPIMLPMPPLRDFAVRQSKHSAEGYLAKRQLSSD